MKTKTLLTGLLGASALLAAPAFADRNHDRGWHRGHWKHYERPHYRPYAPAFRPVVVYPAPRVVYRPVPVYYPAYQPAYTAPAPVYSAPSYDAGSVSIRLNFPL